MKKLVVTSIVLLIILAIPGLFMGTYMVFTSDVVPEVAKMLLGVLFFMIFGVIAFFMNLNAFDYYAIRFKNLLAKREI